jgi:hypothetical protein
MTRRNLHLLLTAGLVLMLTQSAHAQFGIGPFVFNFASPLLARVFLLPFSLAAGCA